MECLRPALVASVLFAALLQTAPPPEPLRGERSLAGRVLTDFGEPLAEVTIRATLRREYSGTIWSNPIVDAAPPPRELAEALAASEKWWSFERAGLRETTTDADGRYAFTDLADGNYDVAVYRRGFEVVVARGAGRGAIQLHADTTVDFFGTPAIWQRFDLRMADGTPPKEAMLWIGRLGLNGLSNSALWTPESPAMLLSAGDWYVTALIGASKSYANDARSARFASARRLVTVSTRKQPEVVTLELHGVPAVEGALVAQDDSTYMQVRGVLLRSGEEPDPALLTDSRPGRALRGGERVQEARIDQDSINGRRYRLAGITPGRWYLGVLRQGKSPPLATAVVDVGEACVEYDFTLPSPDARESVVVRVFEPDGTPLRDCEFRFRTEQRLADGRTYTNGGGLYPERTGACAFQASTENFHDRTLLIAVHPRFGEQSIAIVAGRRDYAIRFVEPAVVTLRMPGYAEHAVGRVVSLSLARIGTEDPTSPAPEPAIAADGTVDLGRLQPGAYRIEVVCDSDPDDHASGLPIAALPFDCVAGPREIVLPFPRLDPLRIAIPASTRGPLYLDPLDVISPDRSRLRRHAEPDADGIATFRDVPPGTYVVSRLDEEKMLVEVPAQGTIRFVATKLRALRVVISDPAGPLARAGLASGDLVVAIGGREFEGREELSRIRQSLRSELVTLTVERAGERFEVVIANAVFNGSGGGGSFVDAIMPGR